MTRSEVIQADADTWLVMREYPSHPKAVVQRVTGTNGDARYLLLTWEPVAANRRLVGIHGDLDSAINAVPWPSVANTTPPIPGLSDDADRAHEARQQGAGEARLRLRPLPCRGPRTQARRVRADRASRESDAAGALGRSR